MRSFAGLAIVMIVLCGCGGKNANLAQEQFIEKIEKLKDEYSDASGDEMERNKKAEIIEFLKNTQHSADLWNAEIEAIEADGPNINVKATYKNQWYTLVIFDPLAQATARALKRNDQIIFSGDLGPERSMTFDGGLKNPEYVLYPTRITKDNATLLQAAEVIAAKINEQQKLIQQETEQQDSQQQLAQYDAQIKDDIEKLCKEAVVQNLKIPESASFAWFKSQYGKVAENRWVYSNVVEAKNDFGGVIPRRFQCSAKLSKNNRLSVSVVYVN